MIQKCINIEKNNEKIENYIKKLDKIGNTNILYYFYPSENEMEKIKKIRKFWISNKTTISFQIMS